MAYNISAFAGAGAQFFDDNGAPLVGGLLYTYAAGTTTPLTTYTDSTGTVANTNPIVLDAAGRTPNEIWIDGGLLYKFVLKDSSDVLIGTYDNIPGIDDPTAFNNLITVIGTNTLLGTAVPPINEYVTGATYSFVVPNTNTGAVTISIDGLGAKEITYAGSVPLFAGQLVANTIVVIQYDGTRFQLMQSSASIGVVASLSVTNNATVGGTLTVTGATAVTSPSFSVAGNNISAVNSLGFRNRLINGSMAVAQRATSATITAGSTIAAGYSTVDRFYVYCTGANVTAAQTTTSAVNRLRITGAASVTAVGVGQRIEASNSFDLAGGTATLSVDLANSLLTTVTWTAFYANTTDTFGTLASPTRTQIATGTFTVTSTVTRYNAQISIPAAATTGIEVVLTVGAQTSGTWDIGNIQLEAGSVATPFERRDYGRELMMCQRYYGRGKSRQWGAVFETATGILAQISFPVTMRTAPTITRLANSTWGSTAGDNTNTTGYSFAAASVGGVSIAVPVGSSRVVGLPATCATDDFVEFSAEL